MNELVDRYKLLLKDDFKNFEKYSKNPLRQSIRVNTLKTSTEELISRLKKKGVDIEKVPFLDCGFIVNHSRFSIGSTSEYLQGYYYIQEIASQVPVQVLMPSQNDLVLDMAAAPGGKTTQAAQYMKNTGCIFACEKKSFRLESLKNNLNRLGVRNTLVYKKDSRFAQELNTQFDKILLDAPCSGNYMIDEDWFNKRNVSDILSQSKIQRELLKSAFEVLKPGGTIVYSTCSLEPEENEQNIDWFVGKYGVTIEKINLQIGSPGLTNIFGTKLNDDVTRCIRFWPHVTNTSGFFVAKLRKNDS